MLDLISPNAAKAFKIPVIRQTKKVKSNDVTRQEILMEGPYTDPFELFYGNHRSYDPGDNAFEVMTTSSDYDCPLRTWYLEKHTARGTTTSYLHFPHRGFSCYGHEKIHPEYFITYDKCVALNKDAIHIGSLVQSTPSML